MKNKGKFLKIFIYLCLIGYVCLTAFLVYQSSLDGKTSSGVSGNVGGGIADIIDDGQDKTKLKEPKEVFIKNPITEAKIGESYTLKVDITPIDCSYKSLSFSSSDSKVATVTSAGKIDFLSKGVVTINVWSTEFKDIKDSITIEVTEIELIDFEVNLLFNDRPLDSTSNIYKLNQYQSYNLEFAFNPVNATNKTVKYEYNETYLSINNDVINAIKPTTFPIDITMSVGEYKKTIRIEVIEELLIIQPEKLVINNPINEAKVGTTHTLKVSILPKEATYKSLVYKSSDTNIAKVSSNGKITFINPGSVTITISSKDFKNIKTKLVIEVIKIQLEDFSFEIYDEDNLLEPLDGIYNLKQYQSYTIKNTFAPTNASLKTITYSYSVMGIVSVSKGTINALSPTEEPVEIKMKCDGIEKSFMVTVSEGTKEVVELEKLNITKTSITMKVGEKVKLSSLGITYIPTNVTSKTLSYISNDEKVVDVESSNLVAKSAGNTILTIKHEQSGLEVQVSINVENIIKVDSENPYTVTQNYISYKEDKYYIRNGYSGNIFINFDETSTYTDVKFASSNTNVIIIGTDGSFSPVSEGEAIITILIDDGISKSIEYEIKIIVENPKYTKLQNFIINNEVIELKVGDKVRLSSDPFGIEFVPEDASNKNLNYKSNNSRIVQIKSSTLQAISAGSAIITIFNKESNITKEVHVNVKNIISLDSSKPFTLKQDHLKYDKESNVYTIRNGYSTKLKVNFDEESTFKNVIYSSSDESVLTVGTDGIITPKKIGKAVITITIDDGISEPVIMTINIEVERTPLIEDFSAFLYKVRKSIGHFGAFLVLGIMGSLGLLLMFDKKKWLFSIPLNMALGFGVAGLTEYIQTKVPGRYGCWDDVWLDFSGYMTSTVILTITVLVIYLVIYLKNKKNRSEV